MPAHHKPHTKTYLHAGAHTHIHSHTHTLTHSHTHTLTEPWRLPVPSLHAVSGQTLVRPPSSPFACQDLSARFHYGHKHSTCGLAQQPEYGGPLPEATSVQGGSF